MSLINYSLLVSLTKVFFPLGLSSYYFYLSSKGSLTLTLKLIRSYSLIGLSLMALSEL